MMVARTQAPLEREVLNSHHAPLATRQLGVEEQGEAHRRGAPAVAISECILLQPFVALWGAQSMS